MTYLHLVLVAIRDHQKIVFHYSTDSMAKMLDKQEMISQQIPHQDCGFHILGTSSAGFDSIAKIDPYFKNCRLYRSFKEFQTAL